MRRTSALALTTTTALLLAACTAGGTPDAGTAADGPTAAATPGGDAAAPTAPEADEPLAPATPECLLGTWELDLTAMQDDLRRSVAGGGDAVQVDVAGTATYVFAEEGRFTATVDSTSSMTMSADGSELTSTSASTGDLTGAWSLEGGVLVISDVDTADLTVDTAATMDGEDLDVPAGTAQDAIEVLPPTSSTASCGPDRLALVMTLQEDEDAEPVAVTYTLRR